MTWILLQISWKIRRWKNCENRSTFVKFKNECIVAQFLLRHSVFFPETVSYVYQWDCMNNACFVPRAVTWWTTLFSWSIYNVYFSIEVVDSIVDVCQLKLNHFFNR